LEIAYHRDKLTNPAWQWVYGMMATYGLRNHEVFFLTLQNFPWLLWGIALKPIAEI
jgi:hypothetical protein